MRIKCSVFISTVILFFLASCASKTSTILGDITCEAPCWRGIVAGQSTFKEVETKVNNMIDVQSLEIAEKTIYENPHYEKYIIWEFINVNEYSGEVYFRDEISTLLNINMENELPLSRLIKKFGEPEEVLVQSSGVGDPFIYLIVELIYTNKGICLSHQPSLPIIKNPERYRIGPSTKIRNVSFMDPSIRNNFLEFGCLRGMDEDYYKKIKQKWEGYREYEVVTWD